MLGRLAAGLLVVVPATACGIGSDRVSPPAEARQQLQLEVPAADALGRGCGEQAGTDEAVLAADRSVARCAPGSPEPRPLPTPTTIRIGIGARTESLAPLLLADHLGELAAENLQVVLVEEDEPGRLFEALTSGDLDAVAGDLDGPFFDQRSHGSSARLVLGGPIAAHPYDSDLAQAGLWIRSDLVEDDDAWANLENGAVAVEQGIADAAAYPIHNAVMDHDLSLNELSLVHEDGQAAADGMLAGHLVGAWLDDPFWRPVAADDRFTLVTTLPASESLSGLVLAERLLDPARDRDAGLALCRALIRTINTSLAGDYQADDDVVAALVEATGLSRDDIVRTPGWIFDWEVRFETVVRIQLQVVPLGGVIYEEEIRDAQLVDRSLYEDVIRAA